MKAAVTLLPEWNALAPGLLVPASEPGIQLTVVQFVEDVVGPADNTGAFK